MRLLKIELKKLLPYRVFWLFIVAYYILLPFFLSSFHKFEFQIRNGSSIGVDFYYFPDVWHNVTYIVSWFNFILYFFMIVIITNEFQFKTLRQHVIDGLSRSEVLLGKLWMVFIFAVTSTFFVSLSAFSLGFFMTDSYDPQTAFIKSSFIGGFFLQTLGHLVFVLFLSLILKRQGFTIIFYMIYALILENILKFKILTEPFNQYLPLKIFGELIPNPFPSLFGIAVPAHPPLHNVYISLIYIVGLIGLSFLILKKRSL